jgi:hypothetical protein
MARAANDPYARRRFLSSITEARIQGSGRLARHWDRRLRRTGKYFATFDLGDGWRARAVLALERRHVFPEPGVPDRTIAQWRSLLGRVIERWPEVVQGTQPLDHQGFGVEVDHIGSLPKRLLALVGRPPQFREFEACHRLRHRDIAADLVLAYAEHRTGGLVDMTLLLRAYAQRQPSDASGTASPMVARG